MPTSFSRQLPAGYGDTYVNGVRYRVRTVDIRVPEPMSVAVGATYDATIADTNNLHRRVLIICSFAIGAATFAGWLLAAFAVRPLKRLAEQTRQIDAGDEAPDVEVRGASEAVEIAEAVKAMLQRIWNEQDRTKAALASARDFSAVSAHELRTPLTAMRTNLEVLATLDLPDEQRKEVINDVIRTQSRVEDTLGALERLAQGELSTSDDHVPVDITELLDRAAHDAMRVYPDLDVSLVPAPTVIIVGLPAGLRLAVDNAIANAVKHGGATRVQLSAVSSRAGVEIAIDDDGIGHPRGRAARGVRAVLPGVDGLGIGLRPRPGAGRAASRIARRHSIIAGQPAGRRAAVAAVARAPVALLLSALRLAAVPAGEARLLGALHVAEPDLGDRLLVRRTVGRVIKHRVLVALHRVAAVRCGGGGRHPDRTRAVRFILWPAPARAPPARFAAPAAPAAPAPAAAAPAAKVRVLGHLRLTLRIIRASVSTRPRMNARTINHQFTFCITALPTRVRREDPREPPLRLSA